jgi:hypothetical protein
LKLAPLLQQPLFFFKFAFTKVAKATKKKKKKKFTNTKKQIKHPSSFSDQNQKNLMMFSA